MKVLNSIVRNKWFIGGVGLLAISLLLWFGLGFVRFGESSTVVAPSVRLVLIGVISLVWLTWNLSQLWISHRQNSNFLDELAKTPQENDERSQKTSYEVEEMNNMAERFRNAIGILKNSRFSSKNRRSNLYELPWYIVIGPPGAGKTTALVNSGLNFPLSNSHGKQALGGIGGTRHCDWWFTNDAVLIDTAGRYTTQDSHETVDGAAWEAFLNLLKKYRRRRPINGVIVAVSLQDILIGSESQKEEYAHKIRARIDELQRKFEIDFPVYFIFTKMDLIAGFNEYFSSLSKSEREQIFGVDFENGNYDKEQLYSQYGEIVNALNGQTLELIDNEKNIDSRVLINNFPTQFEELMEPISDFIEQCFASHRFNKAPLLRGVYFTSATQEGSPIDRMAARIGKSFSLENIKSRNKSFESGKSFFINQLFKSLIFQESELAGFNKKIENMMIWSRRLIILISLAFFVISISLWISGVAQNKLIISKLASSYNSYKLYKKEMDNTQEAVKIEDVLPLLNPLLSSLQRYEDSKNSLTGILGLHDSRLSNVIRKVYEDELKSTFLFALRDEQAKELSLNTDDDELFILLKSYLMLFDKDNRDGDYLKKYFYDHWKLSFSNSSNVSEELLLHLSNLIKVGIPNDGVIDSEIVSSARDQLYKIPLSRRLYTQLKQQGGNDKIVNFYHSIGSANIQVFGINERDPILIIPYLFTKQGFKNIDIGVNSKFMKDFQKDYWVYGNDYSQNLSKDDLNKLSEDLENLYLQEYVERWTAFYNAFSLERFPRGNMMISRLKKLADPVSSPLLKITEIVVENTELNKAPRLINKNKSSSEAVANLTDSLIKKNLVDVSFSKVHQLFDSFDEQPTKFQEILTTISTLADFMAEIESAQDPNQSAFEFSKKRFMGDNTGAFQPLNLLSDAETGKVKEWAQAVSKYTWLDILERSKSYIDEQWKYQVYETYRYNIHGRYPMLASVETEIGVDNFNDFFKPEGIYQTFYKNYLSPYLDNRKWQLKKIDNLALELSSNTLTQLNRAEMIKAAYFSKGDSFTVDVRIKADKLSSNVKLFNLDAGDGRFSYSHGPRLERPLSWTSGSGRTRFLFEGVDGRIATESFGGNWSLFRFYDAVDKPIAASSSSSVLSIDKDGYSVKMYVLSNTRVNPLYVGLLRNFSLDSSL